MKKFKVSLGAFVVLTVVLTAVALTASGPALGDTNNCPTAKYNSAVTSNLVGATASVSGNTVTYKFDSFTNESPSGGIPGLIEYCVYSDTNPDGTTVSAVGDNGGAWTEPPSFDNFSYSRPDGDPSNIGLDGNNHTMGTATWNLGVPLNYDRIVLHINDPAECASLYGAGTLTCFVLPGSPTTNTAEDLTVSKTANPSFNLKYGWTVDKSADPTTVYSAGGGQSGSTNYTVSATHDSGTPGGWTVAGTITVANGNTFDVAGVNVTDSIDNSGDCTVSDSSGGVDHTDATIPHNGSVGFPYSCTFSSNPGSGTNTGTATWDKTTYGTPTGTASGTANYDFTGIVPTAVNDCTTVVDDNGTPLDTSDDTTLGPVCVGDSGFVDNGDGTFTYTFGSYSKTFTGDPAGTCTDHTNTVTSTPSTNGVSGSDDSSGSDTSSATVSDCQGADLKVSKDATPSFTRTFAWSITKAGCLAGTGGDTGKACVASVTIDPWLSATFNYVVTASHDSGTDSAWAVKGTITLTNPNDWEAITLNSVGGLTDALNSSGACTLDTAGPYTVPAAAKSPHVDGSLQVGYTCATASASDNLNTATANWDADKYSTPTGTASGTKAVAFTTPTTVLGNCTTVTDTFNGGSANTLGKVCVNDTPAASNLNPGGLSNFSESYLSPTFTFKYSRTIKAPTAGSCQSYKNTAQFTTDDTGKTGKAYATVQVCSYNAPLTIGYWGNHLAKNGTTGCSGLPNGTGCSANGPWTNQLLGNTICTGNCVVGKLSGANATLGTAGYTAGTFQDAAKVIAANNCGNASSSDSNAAACLAAQLLAAELNVANGANPCACDIIAKAKAALTAVGYNGPGSTIYFTKVLSGGVIYNSGYTRTDLVNLKTLLDNYNNSKGCPA